MSSNLYWKPVIKYGTDLNDELKHIIAKKFALPRLFDRNDISYLAGLRDAGIKGAGDLMKAIERHEQVEVWESH